jgi:uncharacterized protein (TIGR03437 family)
MEMRKRSVLVLQNQRVSLFVQLVCAILALASGAEGQQQASSPQISATLNAASYAVGGALAPGVIFAVFGTNLTDGTSASAPAIPLSTRLASSSVLVNGFAAPLYYASPTQINAQFPVELGGLTGATIQVQVQTGGNTLVSPSITVPVGSSSPAIFTLDQNGKGPGIIFHASTFNFVCPPGRTDCGNTSLAAPGEVLSIYLTGLGQVTGSWFSGQIPSTALPTVITPTVTIGGIQAQVLFAGLTTNYVGIYQVNVAVPANAPGGTSIPLLLSLGTATSNSVNIAISGTNPLVSPDLAVNINATPDPVVGGGTLTYTATVQNIGNASAPNTTLTDALPTEP